MDRSRLIREITNVYPPWSDTRADEQSLGFNILNVGARQVEDLTKSLRELTDAYCVTTANTDTVANLYAFDLGNDYEFTVNNDNLVNPVYADPVVSGVTASGVTVAVDLATDNSLEEMLAALPSRMMHVASESGINLLLTETVDQTPFTSIADPVTPNNLTIRLSFGEEYLAADDDNNVHRGRVIVTGTTAKGTTESETLIFIHDETQITRKEWKSDLEIEVFDIAPTYTVIEVFDMDFRTGPYLDFYNFEYNFEREKSDVFWTIDVNGNYGGATLDRMLYSVENLFSRIAGGDFLQQHAEVSFELLDTSGANILALDLAIKPFTTNIYIINQTMLYIYDSDVALATQSLIPDKTASSMCKIQTRATYFQRGDTLDVDLYFKRPINSIARHRLSVLAPDGVQYGVFNNALTDISSNFWIEGDPVRRKLRNTEQVVLDAIGEWVFTLEVVYVDGLEETDQRTAIVPSKSPLFELDLTTILPASVSDITGIAFDGNQQLWVVDDNNIRYRLSEHKDVMLVDFQNKRMFFFEEYDTVRVIQ